MFYRPFENFTELKRTVTCMVLKAKGQRDRRTSSPLPRCVSWASIPLCQTDDRPRVSELSGWRAKLAQQGYVATTSKKVCRPCLPERKWQYLDDQEVEEEEAGFEYRTSCGTHPESDEQQHESVISRTKRMKLQKCTENPIVAEIGVQELWFQQDGTTCHTARATIDLLKDTFGDRLISRFGPVNWPPRSCDLTPLDYFLWGYVKSLVYADKPQTLYHLEDNIRRVIADIRPQMLEKVIENWTSRLDYIRASRGSPMPEIIFKM
ncbi:uncharacterized protein TNCV_2688251 [Trichonephila clavipes]|nr:uncharacterized protein TNCV_2688251 [Trichonephila clavipes]